MNFFVLWPFYWLMSVLLVASSQRHVSVRDALPIIISPKVAQAAFVVFNLLVFLALNWFHFDIAVNVINVLLLNAVFLPLSIVVLTHKLHWLWPILVVVTAISVVAQLIAGGHYVA